MKVCDNMRRINYLHGEINSAYHQLALKLKMSDATVEVLYVLCTNDDVCPLTYIYKYAYLPKQTVNSVIRNLENKGLVKLEMINGKSKNIYLTEMGKDVVKNTIDILIKIENDIFSSWNLEDVKKYIELNDKYAKDVKKRISEI